MLVILMTTVGRHVKSTKSTLVVATIFLPVTGQRSWPLNKKILISTLDLKSLLTDLVPKA